MESIFIFFIGIIAGISAKKIYESRYITSGYIAVDHVTELCKVHISSEKLSNKNIKKVIFTVKHDCKISRDDQGL